MPAAIAAVFIAIGVGATTALVIGQIVTTVLVNLAVGAIQKALTKKPKQFSPPVNVTVKNTIENRRIVFGTRRCGGSFVFLNTSSSGGTKLDLLWMVVVFTGHQVDQVGDIYLDNELVPDSAINPTTGAITGTRFAGKLNIFRFNGTSGQTAQSDLDSAFVAWTSAHRLRGCAYVVLRLVRDDAAYPTGAPQSITAVIRGAKLYDSRFDSTNGGSGSQRATDPSTWLYSANPALQLRWYLTGGSVHNDQSTRLVMYGLREPDSRIDEPFFRAAANICEEIITGGNEPPSGSQFRYQCHLEVSTGEDRETILQEILDSMAGTLTYLHGKWRAYAGAYDSPLYSFTELDLYGDLSVSDTTPHDQRYNAVAPVFFDKAAGYTQATGIFRTDSAYETQDGGERIPREIDLRGVTDQYQAQRLAEIELRKSRMMRTIKIVGALNLMKVSINETFTLSHTRYGWVNRVFRCMEKQFEFIEDAGRVSITARQESAGVYTDILTADYTTGTSATDIFTMEVPDAPTSLTVETFALAIRFTVGLPSYFSSGYVVELFEHTASTPFSSATKIAEGRGSVVVVPKRDTTTRFYWVRIKSPTGALSDTFPASVGSAGVSDFAGTGDLAPNAATDSLVFASVADGSIAYASATQPILESSGVNCTASYTSPAGTATQVDVSFAVQGRISNTTSGTAVGQALLTALVQVNGSTVFTRDLILEDYTTQSYGLLAGMRSFSVPASQTLQLFLVAGRSFSSGGLSPAQTIFWKGAMANLLAHKR